MDYETIKLSKPMVQSIRCLISKTKLFRDEQDFIEQAVIKQMSKFKDA